LIRCISNNFVLENNFCFKVIKNLNIVGFGIFLSYLFFRNFHSYTLDFIKVFLLQKSVSSRLYIKNPNFIFISLNFRTFRARRIRQFRSSRVSVQPPETYWVRVRLPLRVRSPSSSTARTPRWPRQLSTFWWNSEIKLKCFWELFQCQILVSMSV
jgi:hypothetical protein